MKISKQNSVQAFNDRLRGAQTPIGEKKREALLPPALCEL
jgi:hypothetical protein